MHFLQQTIAKSVHPIPINVVGTGGTGSHVLRALADINQSLIGLGHSGLFVRAFDDDRVSEHNRGRQPYAAAEVGQLKAVSLINRINRFYGTNWQAMELTYRPSHQKALAPYLTAHITISCVDSVQSRFDIEAILEQYCLQMRFSGQIPYYWLDYGNDRFTGQVFLSTLTAIQQPTSKKFLPVSELPLFTRQYRTTLQAIKDNNSPSCSTRQALERQDLFINPTLALLGCRLLWTLLTDGMISNRGLFLNLADYKIVPVPLLHQPAA